MASDTRRWPDHSGGDEVGKAIIWRVERREFGDRAAPICDDHFFTSLDTVEVFAQTVLEVADSDLRS